MSGEWLAAFVPSRRAWAGPLLIDLNVLVFAAMALSGQGFVSFDAETLYRWGANFGPALQGVGWLRLLTSVFVHGGILHLAMNMYSLFYAARLLEALLGSVRFLLGYLLCGLVASYFSTLIHPEVVSVGASGAIFGCFGLLLTLLLFGDARLQPLRRAMLGNIVTLIAMNLLVGASTPGIDNAAHIGGLATGAVLGIVIARVLRR